MFEAIFGYLQKSSEILRNVMKCSSFLRIPCFKALEILQKVDEIVRGCCYKYVYIRKTSNMRLLVDLAYLLSELTLSSVFSLTYASRAHAVENNKKITKIDVINMFI